MELRVLNYFLAVAREQNISAAAEFLHVSQPTLSIQLKDLEDELGKQLLIRGTKGSRRVTLTEEGMIVDNVYFDNIIHICVFQGKQRLYAKDINKEMFENIIPADFLKMAILSDMSFMGVDSDGYHYQATVSMPDELSCYYVTILIDRQNNISFKLKE